MISLIYIIKTNNSIIRKVKSSRHQTRQLLSLGYKGMEPHSVLEMSHFRASRHRSVDFSLSEWIRKLIFISTGGISEKPWRKSILKVAKFYQE